jgi:selenide,water dikinase
MQRSDIPLTRDLVLIGGGHTHALVLRKWGMRPLPGVRLTLINPGPTAPYSGMLPGHIAGHYDRDTLEIDLVKLARFCGARLILDHATGIDAAARHIHLAGRPPVAYDMASLDVGITADMPSLPGFADHAVAAKPLDIYCARWGDYLDAVRAREKPPRVAVIGAGVAGVELAMAMGHALRGIGQTPRITVLEASEGITGVPPATSRRLAAELAAQDIALRLGTAAARVTAEGVETTTGDLVPAAFVLGAGGARSHGFLAGSDLPLTDGFVTVNPDLRVKGHDDLFAVGDCAHLAHAPRPKAGVFAVRAAPVLHDNLRAVLTGGRTRPFRPQRDYLKLVSLGRKAALAEKAGIALAGSWLWQLKNRIDTTFMEQFAALPAMARPDRPAEVAEGVAEILDAAPLCGGCGAKIGGNTLKQSLISLPAPRRPDLLSGPGDDAAILACGDARQVLSTDHLRAFTEDYALLARIAAIHALGDVWSMGAKPQAALASVVIPRMTPALQARTLAEIMQAAAEVFGAEGAAIVGGHSTMGAEMSVGFTVTGLSDGAPITQAGARAGDALILTRPIGSGTLLAAEMAGQARGRNVALILGKMARPQGKQAKILSGAHAMTDVTGFGLAGHLLAICAASGVSAEIDLEAVPVYEGALDATRAGHRSVLWPENRADAPVFGPDSPRAELLHDPQTAGGMLAAVDPANAEALVARLRDSGAEEAAVIGHITGGPPSITLSSR